MSSLTKSSSTSAPALKLPAELWLHIFEFATGPSIDPAGYCNHLNFPHIDRHHRFPCDYPSLVSPAIRDLRHVCTYFNALLQASPEFHMNDFDSTIPATTRALYITSKYALQTCLQRLLTDPLISGQIVILNLVGSHQAPPVALGFLFDNGSSLPSVRTLALDVVPRCGSRVQESRGPGLGSFKPSQIVAISTAPTCRIRPAIVMGLEELYCALESLLMRNIEKGSRLDWRLLPNLRLLGLPAINVDILSSPPRGHPLRHIYMYVGMKRREDHDLTRERYEEELAWFEGLAGRVPMVSRFSLMFGLRSGAKVPCISAEFLEPDLEALGFVENPLIFEAVGGRCKALDRIHKEPKNDSLYSGSNRFLCFVSRKLHI